MYTLLVSLVLFASILLVLVILAQNSKGGGLSSQFGGSGASNMIGVKKTTDLLENITWILAISVLALTLSTNFVPRGTIGEDFSDRMEENGPALNFPESQIPADDASGLEFPEQNTIPSDSSN